MRYDCDMDENNKIYQLLQRTPAVEEEFNGRVKKGWFLERKIVSIDNRGPIDRGASETDDSTESPFAKHAQRAN